MKKKCIILFFSLIFIIKSYDIEGKLLDMSEIMLEQYNNAEFQDDYLFGVQRRDGFELMKNYMFSLGDLNIYHYNKKPYTGRVYNNFVDGNMKNGKLVGILKTTWVDGKTTVAEYIDGRVIKIKYEKKLKGKKSGHIITLNAINDCVSYMYPEYEYKFKNKNIDGTVQSERCRFSLKNGKLDGEYRVNYEDSDIRHFELNFKNGKLDGKIKNWDKDDNLIYENDIVNGTGEVKFIYEDMIIRIFYKTNKKHGKIYTEFMDGEYLMLNEYYFYGIRLLEEKDFINLEVLEKKNELEKIYIYLKEMKSKKTLKIRKNN